MLRGVLEIALSAARKAHVFSDNQNAMAATGLFLLKEFYRWGN